MVFNPRYKYIDPATAKTIGEFCKILRERERCSMREWSKQVGELPSSICAIENDEIIRPMTYLAKCREYIKSKREEEILAMLLLKTLVIPKREERDDEK